MNLKDLQANFDTNEKCLEFIEKLRWPDGVRCVVCGCVDVYRIQSSSEKQRSRRLFECVEPSCRQQFSATSGTIMHDTHLPLQTWLMAIALITQAKKGMSAKQLQRHLGLGSYKTAWHLAHRIREAMKSSGGLQGGVLEIDETYIGGKKTGRGVKAGKDNKTAVFGVIKRGGNLHLQHINKSSVDATDARDFINENIGKWAQMVCTDESVIYPRNLKHFEHRHQSVNHSAKEYVRYKFIHTNTIENAFSLFKRGIIGNFHQVSAKHLHRYLNEFEYRFNRRNDADLFSKTVQAITRGSALPLAKLLE